MKKWLFVLPVLASMALTLAAASLSPDGQFRGVAGWCLAWGIVFGVGTLVGIVVRSATIE